MLGRRIGRIFFGVTCVVLGGYWLAGGGAVWVGAVLLIVGAGVTIYGMGWW